MAVKYLDAKRLQGTSAERIGDTGVLATQTNGTHTAWYQANGIGWRDVNGWEVISSSEDANGNDMVGQTLTSFKMSLKKASGGTGDLVGGIWYGATNVTATPDVTFTNTISSSIANLSETFTDITFTGSRVLAVGDIIAVSQTSGGQSQMAAETVYGAPAGNFKDQDLKCKIQFVTGWTADTNYEPNGSLHKASDLNDWSDLEAGTVYIETDTHKYQWWNGSTWSESG